MQNGIVTMATVPAIGGRVMQYDLSGSPSIFVNPSEFGKTYVPANNNQWYNFGGFKNWPAPQSQWNTGGWPPPPILDYGSYAVSDTVSTEDSASVSVASSKEQWRAPGIRFKRTATMYAGNSRIKMEQTMTNEGTQPASWSMWDITQSIVHHTDKTDYQNYWAYFPINPNSRYGTSGVYFPNNSAAWKGKIASGVYGIQFVADGKKIFADPHKGWIAYASLSDSVVFVKAFDVFDGTQYPDNGARVAVYVSGSNPAYMEVEVTSPIVELADSGSSYTFTENWWAAKARAPVLDVDSVGVIAGRMSYNAVEQKLSGVYGVFYEGTARVVFLSERNAVLAEGIQRTVSPLNEVQFQETIAIPESAKSVEMQVRNTRGEFVGILERVDVSQLITSVEKQTAAVVPGFRLEQNYPNPFNPTTEIKYQISEVSPVILKVCDALGREAATLVNEIKEPGSYTATFNASKLSSGIYFYTLRSKNFTATKKMMLLK